MSLLLADKSVLLLFCSDLVKLPLHLNFLLLKPETSLVVFNQLPSLFPLESSDLQVLHFGYLVFLAPFLLFLEPIFQFEGSFITLDLPELRKIVVSEVSVIF